MVSALQSLPVTAVASDPVVGKLNVTVAGRFDIVGSRSGKRCHSLSPAGGGWCCGRRQDDLEPRDVQHHAHPSHVQCPR